MIVFTSIHPTIYPSQGAKDTKRKPFSRRKIPRKGMAAVPNSYLMAKSRKKKKAERSSDQFQSSGPSNQPLCYNNKMMNSIWGQYNMYSVHNIKAVQNDGALRDNAPLQQMLQDNQSVHSIDMATAQTALRQDISGYAGRQLSNLEKASIKKVIDFFGH